MDIKFVVVLPSLYFTAINSTPIIWLYLCEHILLDQTIVYFTVLLFFTHSPNFTCLICVLVIVFNLILNNINNFCPNSISLIFKGSENLSFCGHLRWSTVIGCREMHQVQNAFIYKRLIHCWFSCGSKIC